MTELFAVNRPLVRSGGAPIVFDNSYARLPERFFARIPPTPVAAPKLIAANRDLADQLGIDAAWIASSEGVGTLAGNRLPFGAEPLAMAYAGHQFGNWVPQLGDGRAILLGEVIDHAGIRRDLQLKGAGPTPFSRNGDGRAALGPVLREYIVSEAMAALGVPTTRALAAVTTGEPVMRDAPLQGAILTRVARSHVRVGTFEFFANRGDSEGVKILADYVIARLYPDVARSAEPYRTLLASVITRIADLVAAWQLIGFIHGVMNTDNMSIAGETIDFGPCAFMDAYHPQTVFSSIDRHGRYAYANQPRIALWNLARLAETLLPLLHEEQDKALAIARETLEAFASEFERSYLSGMRRKLGLLAEEEGDGALANDLLAAMAANRADFTLTFRGLGNLEVERSPADDAVRGLFDDPQAFDSWALKWRQRRTRETQSPSDLRAIMRGANPAFIPRNHRIEAAIAAAEERSDFSLFETLLSVLASPYEDQPAFTAYMSAPRPEEVVHQTFCGT